MQPEVAAQPSRKPRWAVGVVSLGFILLQSACTAVMAISGVRVVIGLSALAAASGLNRPASGFHQDAIRIPMMIVAIGGSLLNLYVIWRTRSLRNRPSAQWRIERAQRLIVSRASNRKRKRSFDMVSSESMCFALPCDAGQGEADDRTWRRSYCVRRIACEG